MSYSVGQVLHTKWDDEGRYIDYYGLNYSAQSTFLNPSYEIDNQIQKLKAREFGFYANFGYNDYDSFMNGIRSILKDISQDRVVFERLSNTDIFNFLVDRYTKVQVTRSSEVIIRINENDKFKIGLDSFNFKRKDMQVSIKGQNFIELDAVLNTKNVRDIVKKFFSDKDSLETIKTYGPFGFLQTLLDSGIVEITVAGQPKGTKQVGEKVNYVLPNYPFGYKKGDLEKLQNFLGEDTSIDDYLNNVVNELRKIYVDEIGAGGSSIMKEALRRTFDETLKDKILSFFSTGKTSLKIGQTGKAGEYQMAVLGHYLDIKAVNSPRMRELIKIIADEGNPRVDVLIDHFGIQSKNWQETSSNSVDTYITPKDIVHEHLATEAFLPYVAHFYFLEEYNDAHSGEEKDIKDYIEKYAMERLNFSDTRTGFDDSIDFYIASGKYLVPASEILLSVKNSLGSVTITTPNIKPKSSAYFNPPHQKDPPFLKYWRRSKSAVEGFSPTAENKTTFEQIINSVHYHTKFNYQVLISPRYALF